MAIKRGKSAENHFASYKVSKRWESNRRKKLEKQLKLQPNNEQVKKAMSNIYYRRKTPVVREWSATTIRMAKIIKLFTGRFDRDILSSNKDTASLAIQKSASRPEQQKGKNQVADKNFFSIGARLSNGSLT